MFYKHSGHFSVGGLVVSVTAGAAASTILAALYAAGIILIPDAHLAAFANVAFGALVGVAAGYGLMLGKVRNERAALAVAAVVSGFALYASWAMWVHNVLKVGRADAVSWTALASRPVVLWNLICLINQHGTWGLNDGQATRGLELWVYWVLEAATVIAMGIWVARGVWRIRPYCETCGRWTKRAVRMLLASPQSLVQLKQQLAGNDIRELANSGPGTRAADHPRVELYSCDACSQFHILNVTHMAFTRSKGGKPRAHETRLVKHQLLGPGEAETIRQLSIKVDQTAKSTGAPRSTAAIGR